MNNNSQNLNLEIPNDLDEVYRFFHILQFDNRHNVKFRYKSFRYKFYDILNKHSIVNEWNITFHLKDDTEDNFIKFFNRLRSVCGRDFSKKRTELVRLYFNEIHKRQYNILSFVKFVLENTNYG